MGQENIRKIWLALAKKTARRINRAWFLEKLAIPLLALGVFAAGLILILRRALETLPYLPLSLALGTAFSIVTLTSYYLARKRFTTSESTLHRIDSAQNLSSSLAAAKEGIAAWPDTIKTNENRDGLRWNWPRLLLPPLLTLLMVSLALLLPVAAKKKQLPPEEPVNRQLLQESIDQLRQDDVVDEDYLDEMEEKLKKLREEPEENWFDHSAMEATDNLKNSHERNLDELEQNLSKSERALNALQNHSENMTPETRERLMNEFDQALEQMEQGSMKPNQQLLEQLKNLDAQQLGNLSQEQLDALRENMRQQAQKMQQDSQQGAANDEWLDEWKVFLSSTASEHGGQADKNGMRRVFSRIMVGGPGTACTETYLVAGRFATQHEAENFSTYLRTRFVRFLVSLRTNTQHLYNERFAFVPDLPMDRIWTDDDLYREFNISESSQLFIESMIRPIEEPNA